MIKIEFKPTKTISLAKGFQKDLRDLSPPLRKWGSYMVDVTKEQFESGTDPYGKPWAELSPVTIQRKTEMGYPNPEKILVASGKMVATVRYQLTANGVNILIDFPSEYHQRGTSRMPQRIILGISPERRDRLSEYVREFILDLFDQYKVGVSHVVSR